MGIDFSAEEAWAESSPKADERMAKVTAVWPRRRRARYVRDGIPALVHPRQRASLASDLKLLVKFQFGK